MTFGERVTAAVAKSGPLCVGVDPSPELLRSWSLSDDRAGLQAFCSKVLEAATGVAAVIKPQVAFFERHGAAGMRVLEHLILEARERQFLVIADAKRGDIGSTATAYGQVWLETGRPLCVDAVTVSAYLGFRALQPMIEVGRGNGNGVIVVARSSNPEGDALQGATLCDGGSVAEHLLHEIASANAQEAGQGQFGTVGAVVGATTSVEGSTLLGHLGGVVLAPGFGAQGAQAPDLDRVFSACPPTSVVAGVSRAILREGPLHEAMREAAQQWQAAFRRTRVGRSAPADAPVRGQGAPAPPEARQTVVAAVAGPVS